MYSNIKSVQLLVAMLKGKEIKNIVISAGTSHDAIVRSIEEDGFFKTYSVVDERSAAFFALGLIQQLQEPVAIICTSGTAASNYLSGVTEAYYRKLPLIVVTADKNHYYLNQREDQSIPQTEIYNSVIKYKVDLPFVENEKDYWYCERVLNEAFLEMNHHGCGPIQINIPIEGDGMFAIGKTFSTSELPKVKIINRIETSSSEEIWQKKSEELKKYSKIILIYGQNNPISSEEKNIIEKFAKKYNCIIATEKMSNLYNNYTVETSRIGSVMSKEQTEKLMPEIVIVVNGNYLSGIKGRLKANSKRFKSWLVSEEGVVEDQFKNLTDIFECTTMEFLDRMQKLAGNSKNNNEYINSWKEETKKFKITEEIEYSDIYAIKELFKVIPEDSILNLSNSTTPRIANLLDLNENIPVYCNRGVNGIDGSMSTFIGQSAVTDKLSFLIIGDLSFFYDMNALWNRYMGKNIRIMLNNNEGATLFHYNQGLKRLPTLNNAIAAEHFTQAKGWVESQGFEYLTAHNKEEFDKKLVEFVKNDSDKPIFFEVFTDKAKDAEIFHKLYEDNKDVKTKIKQKIKKIIRKG